MAKAGECSPHTTVLPAAWALWLRPLNVCVALVFLLGSHLWLHPLNVYSLGVLAGVTSTEPKPSSSPLLLYFHRDLKDFCYY